MLNVEHITFSYGRRRILSDITFDVAPGEITAVVGLNGAGKTTLLRILAFVLMQDSGNITLDGIDPLTRPVKYRTWIGYLPESCPLYEEMTVEQYLLYRLKLRRERSSRLRRRLADALQICNLRSVADSGIRALSRGFKKRICLADALMQHPRLALLDDPWTGLDAESRRDLGITLTSCSAHAAVILAGHEVDEMLEWCTRFIVLREGCIAASYRKAEHEQEELRTLLRDALSSSERGGNL